MKIVRNATFLLACAAAALLAGCAGSQGDGLSGSKAVLRDANGANYSGG